MIKGVTALSEPQFLHTCEMGTIPVSVSPARIEESKEIMDVSSLLVPGIQ